MLDQAAGYRSYPASTFSFAILAGRFTGATTYLLEYARVWRQDSTLLLRRWRLITLITIRNRGDSGKMNAVQAEVDAEDFPFHNWLAADTFAMEGTTSMKSLHRQQGRNCDGGKKGLPLRTGPADKFSAACAVTRC